MSKILLIEPCGMLQHAFVLALSPEHEVEIAADMKATLTRSAGGDLAIIDAAALRQRSAAPVDVVATLADWQRPIIWIDTILPTDSASASTIQLTLPFSKEELRAAVGKLLQVGPTRNETGRAHALASAPLRRESSKPVAASAESDKKIIELVEVVEQSDEHYDPSIDTDSRN